jgi:hypothetical protein
MLVTIPGGAFAFAIWLIVLILHRESGESGSVPEFLRQFRRRLRWLEPQPATRLRGGINFCG